MPGRPPAHLARRYAAALALSRSGASAAARDELVDLARQVDGKGPLEEVLVDLHQAHLACGDARAAAAVGERLLSMGPETPRGRRVAESAQATQAAQLGKRM